MKRKSWVLWLLLVTLLARTAFAATPEIYSLVDADSTALNSSASIAEHTHPCGTAKDTAETQTEPECCSGKTCGADCMMASCLLLTLPGATIQYRVHTNPRLDIPHLITFPSPLHFPFLRPPIA